MSLQPGTRLGPYEILSPLGAGGMGEVYRARDTRLSRDVAVKVLPQHLSSNHEVRARFELEAKTISSLNHPHICVLYDIGREGSTDYLVMELVAGETLAARLAKGPMPIAEVLKLGVQIADALDRAHKAGIVHRDLKPGNVMLTKSGAKLMDFGLARATGLASAQSGSMAGLTQSPTVAQPLTAEGTILGTFQYMSPEQLEGSEADPRSDIWALGCVLYEMTTGKRAFDGHSQASLIAAIMTGEPRAIKDLQPVSPPALNRVVTQCLQKNPDDRMQSARDLAFALELVAGGDVRDGAAKDRAVVRRAPRAWQIGAAVAIILAGFMIGRMTAPRSVEGSIRVSTLSQGTRDGDPAVSPDGRLVVFSAVRPNGQGLWLMDMVTRSEVNLTSGADRFPRFTADGGTVLFSRLRNGRSSIWRVPVIGGTPRLLLENAADADQSPDGNQMAYVSSASDSAGHRVRLMVAKSDGTNARELGSFGPLQLFGTRWSPDGSRIAITKSGSQNASNSILVFDVSNAKFREFPAPTGSVVSNVIWDGTGNGLLLAEGVGVTAVQRGAPARLFRCDARSGKFQALGWLEDFPATIDMLPDGRLVISTFNVRQNLCEVSSAGRTLTGLRWLTSGMARDRQPVYSPDGKWVMFSSNRGGTLDLWEVSVESGEMHRVTDDPADDWDPEYSPDGQSIVWCSGRSGSFEIWSARRDGTEPRQLSHDGLDAENPSISPDGKWVYYSSAHPDKAGVWRVPTDGGDGEQLLRGGTLIPDLSPDGRYFSVLVGVGTVGARLTVFDVEAREELPAPVDLLVFAGNVQTGRSRFAPDGQSVVYLFLREDGRPVLFRRPLSSWRNGGEDSELLFPDATEAIETFDFSRDGTRVVVSVIDWLSSLTIAEVPGIVASKRSN